MDLSEYKSHRYYEKNTKGRDFICTDLHGKFQMFNDFLTHLQFDPSVDRMFCGGDLIDRGEDSLNCLLLIKQDWFHSVRGNHEQMMIDTVVTGFDEQLWVMNGGRWAYQVLDWKERKELGELAAMLPFIIAVGEGEDRFNIVHAEFTFAPDITDEMIDNYDFSKNTWFSGEPMIWGRDIIQGHPAPHDPDKMSLTFVGHTPLQFDPMQIGRQIYIDGGAVFGNRMFIAEPGKQVIHSFNVETGTYREIPFDKLTFPE